MGAVELRHVELLPVPVTPDPARGERVLQRWLTGAEYLGQVLTRPQCPA